MEKEITYSFIIPHHNTPDLLHRLIDSIPLREDIEIIIVDDNSDEDKKADVCRPDVRKIFIDKEHSRGAGRARNVGMGAACGKWLLFADADDFYKPGFIDVLDEYKDEDIEVLFFNVNFVDSDSLLPIENDARKQSQDVVSQYDGTQQSIDMLLYMGWAPWNKMQRTSFVKEYGFLFEEVPKGNDVFFSMQMGYFVRKWKVDRRTLYSVAYYKNSITFGTKNQYNYKHAIIAIRKKTKFFRFVGHPEWNEKSSNRKHKRSVFIYIGGLIRLSPLLGIKALVYYLTNLISIERKANCYIDEIKRIETNYKRGGIE